MEARLNTSPETLDSISSNFFKKIREAEKVSSKLKLIKEELTNENSKINLVALINELNALKANQAEVKKEEKEIVALHFMIIEKIARRFLQAAEYNSSQTFLYIPKDVIKKGKIPPEDLKKIGINVNEIPDDADKVIVKANAADIPVSVLPRVLIYTPNQINAIELFVLNDIFSKKTHAEIIQSLEYWIRIMDRAHELGDFNTVLGIIGALLNQALQMLYCPNSEYLFISEYAQKVLERTRQITGGGPAEKERLRDCMVGNVVPFLGIYMQDIEFVKQSSDESGREIIRNACKFIQALQSNTQSSVQVDTSNNYTLSKQETWDRLSKLVTAADMAAKFSQGIDQDEFVQLVFAYASDTYAFELYKELDSMDKKTFIRLASCYVPYQHLVRSMPRFLQQNIVTNFEATLEVIRELFSSDKLINECVYGSSDEFFKGLDLTAEEQQVLTEISKNIVGAFEQYHSPTDSQLLLLSDIKFKIISALIKKLNLNENQQLQINKLLCDLHNEELTQKKRIKHTVDAPSKSFNPLFYILAKRIYSPKISEEEKKAEKKLSLAMSKAAKSSSDKEKPIYEDFETAVIRLRKYADEKQKSEVDARTHFSNIPLDSSDRAKTQDFNKIFDDIVKFTFAERLDYFDQLIKTGSRPVLEFTHEEINLLKKLITIVEASNSATSLITPQNKKNKVIADILTYAEDPDPKTLQMLSIEKQKEIIRRKKQFAEIIAFINSSEDEEEDKESNQSDRKGSNIVTMKEKITYLNSAIKNNRIPTAKFKKKDIKLIKAMQDELTRRFAIRTLLSRLREFYSLKNKIAYLSNVIKEGYIRVENVKINLSNNELKLLSDLKTSMEQKLERESYREVKTPPALAKKQQIEDEVNKKPLSRHESVKQITKQKIRSLRPAFSFRGSKKNRPHIDETPFNIDNSKQSTAEKQSDRNAKGFQFNGEQIKIPASIPLDEKSLQTLTFVVADDKKNSTENISVGNAPTPSTQTENVEQNASDLSQNTTVTRTKPSQREPVKSLKPLPMTEQVKLEKAKLAAEALKYRKQMQEEKPAESPVENEGSDSTQIILSGVLPAKKGDSGKRSISKSISDPGPEESSQKDKLKETEPHRVYFNPKEFENCRFDFGLTATNQTTVKSSPLTEREQDVLERGRLKRQVSFKTSKQLEVKKKNETDHIISDESTSSNERNNNATNSTTTAAAEITVANKAEASTSPEVTPRAQRTQLKYTRSVIHLTGSTTGEKPRIFDKVKWQPLLPKEKNEQKLTATQTFVKGMSTLVPAELKREAQRAREEQNKQIEEAQQKTMMPPLEDIKPTQLQDQTNQKEDKQEEKSENETKRLYVDSENNKQFVGDMRRPDAVYILEEMKKQGVKTPYIIRSHVSEQPDSLIVSILWPNNICEHFICDLVNFENEKEVDRVVKNLQAFVDRCISENVTSLHGYMKKNELLQTFGTSRQTFEDEMSRHDTGISFGRQETPRHKQNESQNTNQENKDNRAMTHNAR